MVRDDAASDSYDESATAFRPVDTIHFQRKRADMNPVSWRRNRKKMTELTSITTLKQGTAAKDLPDEATTSQSTRSWLAKRFSSLGRDQPQVSGSGDRAGAVAGEDAFNILGLPKDMVGTVSASDVLTAKQRRRRRRRSRGNDSLCLDLQKQHGVVPCVLMPVYRTLPPSRSDPP